MSYKDSSEPAVCSDRVNELLNAINPPDDSAHKDEGGERS
jgi:hypothetical protein